VDVESVSFGEVSGEFFGHHGLRRLGQIEDCGDVCALGLHIWRGLLKEMVFLGSLHFEVDLGSHGERKNCSWPRRDWPVAALTWR
jgi:hypothetical protein